MSRRKNVLDQREIRIMETKVKTYLESFASALDLFLKDCEVPYRCKGRFCTACSVGESEEWSRLLTEDVLQVNHRYVIFQSNALCI